MAYLEKEFVLDSQENFDEFVNVVGEKFEEELKEKVINYTATIKLVKNEDEYTLVTDGSGTPREVTFTSGVEIDEEVYGQPCKSTYIMEDDELNAVHKFEDDSIIFYRRQFSDDEVIETITAHPWEDGRAKRIYKA